MVREQNMLGEELCVISSLWAHTIYRNVGSGFTIKWLQKWLHHLLCLHRTFYFSCSKMCQLKQNVNLATVLFFCGNNSIIFIQSPLYSEAKLTELL